MLKPLVSVLCITYNHERFIREALLGFVKQKANFDFEIIISDDCSTDNTVSEIRRITSELGLTVKLNVQDVNVGVYRNSLAAYNLCSGKYIAICEGDDFWSSSNKLQKQVDALRDNSDAVAVYHRSSIVNEIGVKKSEVPINGRDYNELDDFLCDFYKIPTCSVMFVDIFRGESLFKYRHLLLGGGYIWDYLLDALLSSRGKYIYLDETLSCYRVTHNTDSFSSQKVLTVSEEMLSTRTRLQKFFGIKSSESIRVSSDIVRMSIFIKLFKQEDVSSAVSFFCNLNVNEKFRLLKQMVRYWNSKRNL